MDTNGKPRRPWWRTKRTWAAPAVAWFVFVPFAYALGSRPAVYSLVRGWLPRRHYVALYDDPLRSVLARYPAVRTYQRPYAEWWVESAYQHEYPASD